METCVVIGQSVQHQPDDMEHPPGEWVKQALNMEHPPDDMEHPPGEWVRYGAPARILRIPQDLFRGFGLALEQPSPKPQTQTNPPHLTVRPPWGDYQRGIPLASHLWSPCIYRGMDLFSGFHKIADRGQANSGTQVKTAPVRSFTSQLFPRAFSKISRIYMGERRMHAEVD